MAETSLMANVRRWLRLAWVAEVRGLSTEEVLTREAEARVLRRRDVLRGVLGVGALMAAPQLLTGCGGSSGGGGDGDAGPEGDGGGGDGGGGGTPTVAVIGAGLAGLHCAYRLQQQGVSVALYDADERAGGRCLTLRDHFGDGLLAELGGELIDSGHATLRALATELGLELVDLFADAPDGLIRDTFYLGGRLSTDAEIVNAFRPVAGRMQGSILTAYPTPDAPDPNEFARLDAMSLRDYLEREIAADRLTTALLVAAYTAEHGLDAEVQSPWNLLWQVDSETADPFRPHGDADKRFVVRGGNDALATKLAEKLTRSVQLQHRLTALAKNADGRLHLTFDQNGTTVEGDFEQVVLALPFTQLRKLASAGLSDVVDAEMLGIIQNLGYGTGAKLVLGFRSRPWLTTQNRSGTLLTDSGLQSFWDAARGQTSLLGVGVNQVGGQRGLDLGGGDAESQAATLLAELEPIFPGVTEQYFPQRAAVKHWPTAPFIEGSRACYTSGQAAWAGKEGVAQGANLFFCGEHTAARLARGTLEGALATGATAAADVLSARGVAAAPLLARTLAAGIRSPAGARTGRRR